MFASVVRDAAPALFGQPSVSGDEDSLPPVTPAVATARRSVIGTPPVKGLAGYSPRKTKSFARPIDVSERQFDRIVSSGLVLVKFGAEWCGPCRKVVPELEQLASDNTGTLTVLSVDIDSEAQLAERHDVGPIPRIILFRDGKQVDSWTGYQPASRLQRIIDSARDSAPKGDVMSNPFAA